MKYEVVDTRLLIGTDSVRYGRRFLQSDWADARTGARALRGCSPSLSEHRLLWIYPIEDRGYSDLVRS